MTEMNMIKALNSALDERMDADEDIVIFGEDIGFFGGVFRVTDGLQKKHGAHRIFDAPLAEGGFAAMAFGMGINGLRPIMEIQFADYIFPAYDQIVNEMAKVRHRSGGEFTCPVTIRAPAGGGIRGGHHHSQSPEAQFTHTPGLKVVYCSTPRNAKGLLTSAMTQWYSLSQSAATVDLSMAIRIMSQLGKGMKMLRSLKDIIKFHWAKQIWSKKGMPAQLLHGEQWSTLHNKQSRIAEYLAT